MRKKAGQLVNQQRGYLLSTVIYTIHSQVLLCIYRFSLILLEIFFGIIIFFEN